MSFKKLAIKREKLYNTKEKVWKHIIMLENSQAEFKITINYKNCIC